MMLRPTQFWLNALKIYRCQKLWRETFEPATLRSPTDDLLLPTAQCLLLQQWAIDRAGH